MTGEIKYDKNKWLSYKYTFDILNEEQSILDKNYSFIFEDIMQFEMKSKDNIITIDIGIYGIKKFELPFIGYTLSVIKNYNWEKPIEKEIILSSKNIKERVEFYLKKYEVQ